MPYSGSRIEDVLQQGLWGGADDPLDDLPPFTKSIVGIERMLYRSARPGFSSTVTFAIEVAPFSSDAGRSRLDSYR